METMSDFFTARVDGYDEHMLQEVEGCREGYSMLAELVPADCQTLLDLGCGTGLELDAILERHPFVEVTGIDLTEAMLQKLRAKHPDKSLRLICGDYFAVPFGEDAFDCALSFESLHHFEKEAKSVLYERIFRALHAGGCYIECDYMVDTQEEETFFFEENRRLRKENGVPSDAYYHVDTPCTIDNTMVLLKKAGFASVECRMRIGGTALLLARK